MQTLSDIIKQKIAERRKRNGIAEQPRTLTESELAWERAKNSLSTLPKDINGLIMEKALDHEPFMYKQSRHGSATRHWAALPNYEVQMTTKTYSYKVEAIVYESNTGEIKDASYAILNEDPHLACVRELFRKGRNLG